VVEESGKSRQIRGEPFWIGSWERRSNDYPCGRMTERVTMEGLNMLCYLSMGSGGQVVAGTSIADEVGEDRGHQDTDIGKTRQRTDEQSFLSAIDKLIVTSN